MAAVNVGDRLDVGQTIRTGANGSARLLMDDESVLNVGPSSELRIKKYQVNAKRRRVTLRLTAGRLWARVTRIFGGRKNFDVETPNAVAGVRGTEFVVDTQSGETTVTVLSGEVSMKGRRGPPVTLLPNAQGRVMQRGRAQRIVLDPGTAKSAITGAGPSGRLSGDNRGERLDSAKQSTGNAPRGEGRRGEGGLRSRPGSDGPGAPETGSDTQSPIGGGSDEPRGERRGPSAPDSRPDTSEGGDRPRGDGPAGGPGGEKPLGDGPRGDAPSDRPRLDGPGSGAPKGEPGAPPSPTPGSGPAVTPGNGGPSSLPSTGKPSTTPSPARPPVIQRPVQRPPVTIPGGGPIGVNPVDPGSRATRIRLRVRVRGQ